MAASSPSAVTAIHNAGVSGSPVYASLSPLPPVSSASEPTPTHEWSKGFLRLGRCRAGAGSAGVAAQAAEGAPAGLLQFAYVAAFRLQACELSFADACRKSSLSYTTLAKAFWQLFCFQLQLSADNKAVVR